MGCHRDVTLGVRGNHSKSEFQLSESRLKLNQNSLRFIYSVCAHRWFQQRRTKHGGVYTHESVSAALAGLSVGDDDGLLDVAELCEELAQGLVRRVVRQSADEDLSERRVLLLHGRAGRRGRHGRCRGQRRAARDHTLLAPRTTLYSFLRTGVPHVAETKTCLLRSREVSWQICCCCFYFCCSSGV